MTHKQLRVTLKNNAKSRIKTSTSNPYLATLALWGVLILIIAVALILSVYLIVFGIDNMKGLGAGATGIFSQTINMVISIISSMLAIGFSWYSVKVYRGEQNRISDIFSGFSKKGIYAILAYFVVGIAVSLIVVVIFGVLVFLGIVGFAFITSVIDGSLNTRTINLGNYILLVCVSILSYYIYYSIRMTNYIIYDENLGPIKAIFKSCKMMKGHKWELFKLDLSFFWWYLLMAVTFFIAGIYVIPYKDTVNAGFYDAIKDGEVDEQVIGDNM